MFIAGGRQVLAFLLLVDNQLAGDVREADPGVRRGVGGCGYGCCCLVWWLLLWVLVVVAVVRMGMAAVRTEHLKSKEKEITTSS